MVFLFVFVFTFLSELIHILICLRFSFRYEQIFILQSTVKSHTARILRQGEKSQSKVKIFLTIFRVFLFSGGSTFVFELLFIFSFCSPQLYLSGWSGGAPAKLKLQLLSLTSDLALLSPVTAFANIVCIVHLVLLLASF